MNIKELLEHQAELKRKGNALWENAMNETSTMSAEDKEKYMIEVRKTDDQIIRDLKSVNEQIEATRRYQEEERQEIGRTAAVQHPATSSAKSPADFTSFGQLLQAIACHASNVVASTFNGAYREELARKLSIYQAAASGMSVGTPADGGYLVRKEWTSEFLTRARQASQLLPLCRIIPIGADADGLEYPYIDETSRVDGSRWGGVQVFWRAEATTVAAKQPKIGKGELRLEDLMGIAYATERLLRDSSALEAVLTSSFESEFGFKIDDSILRGTGSGQMLGILNSPVLVSATREAADVDSILGMYARIPPRLLGNAVWLYHTKWITKLPKMVIGDQPVWLPPGGVASRPHGMILGLTAMPLEQCSAVGTVGDMNLFNLKEYVVIEKANEGMRFDQSMHVRFLYDEMAFRWVYRINGQPIARSALTPYKGTDTLSPFVTLAA